MRLINDYLLSIYYVPGTVVGTEERNVNKTQSLHSSRLRWRWGETGTTVTSLVM